VEDGYLSREEIAKAMTAGRKDKPRWAGVVLAHLRVMAEGRKIAKEKKDAIVQLQDPEV
jgi:hypothetical protein